MWSNDPKIHLAITRSTIHQIKQDFFSSSLHVKKIHNSNQNSYSALLAQDPHVIGVMNAKVHKEAKL